MSAPAASDNLESLRRHGPHDSALDNDVETKDDMLRLRIRELEEENDYLVGKATSASQRFADYENNIRVLQTQLKEQRAQQHIALETPGTSKAAPEKPGLSRFGSFMRKPAIIPVSSPNYSSSAREQELQAALLKEQTARKEAEKKTREMTAEIEDLSTSLFQQANDMVASERKENSDLKGRIKELENVLGPLEERSSKEIEKLRQRIKILEQRDKERHKRLDKLEAAQRRIDRVRGMLSKYG